MFSRLVDEEEHRGEERPDEEDEEKAALAVGEVEPGQRRTNLHRDCIVVAYPIPSYARTKIRHVRWESLSVSLTPRQTKSSTRKTSTVDQASPAATTMVYESDFYTTRRPYSRPLVSSYSVTVSTLRDSAVFLFISLRQKRADWIKWLNVFFLLHVVLTSRKRESPVCDRKYQTLEPLIAVKINIPCDLAESHRHLTRLSVYTVYQNLKYSVGQHFMKQNVPHISWSLAIKRGLYSKYISSMLREKLIRVENQFEPKRINNDNWLILPADMCW